MIARRHFLATLGCWPTLVPPAGMALQTAAAEDAPASAAGFHRDVEKLLADWCDGLVRRQIDAPGDPRRHGAIDCGGCASIGPGRNSRFRSAWKPTSRVAG